MGLNILSNHVLLPEMFADEPKQFSWPSFNAWFAERTSDEEGVRPSVCLSNVWIVTKRKKDLSRFLYHMRDHLA